MEATIRKNRPLNSQPPPPPSSPSSSSSFTSEQGEKESQKMVRGEFLYGDLLLASLFPPLLVLLAFGGRPMLLTVCFGAIFTYIFDILGAMEVHYTSFLFLSFLFFLPSFFLLILNY